MPENYDEELNEVLERARRMGIDPIDLGDVTPVATPIVLEPDQYEDVTSYSNPEAVQPDFDNITLFNEEDKKEETPNVDNRETNDNLDFDNLGLLEEEQNDNIDFDESIKIGDVVTLNPEIADLLDDYRPEDIFKIETVDGAIATLSRNGQSISELSAIPLNQLNKVNENDYADFFGGKFEKEDEKPIVEKGSKPIRWSSRFIDNIRKNTSVAEISKKLEASQKKDAEKSAEKEMPEGSLVSFKTTFFSSSLRLAKATSKGWNKIKKHHKKDEKVEKDEQEVKTDDTVKDGVNEAVEWFMNQSTDDQKNFLTDLIGQLNAAKKELTEAATALSNANNQIGKLSHELEKSASTTALNDQQVDKELLTEVTHLRTENQYIKEDNENLKAENDRLREEIAKSSTPDNDLATEITRLRAENATIKDDNQKLSSENEQLREENAKSPTVTNGNDALLARIAELEEENKRLKAETPKERAERERNHATVSEFHVREEEEPELSPRAQAWLEQAEKEQEERRRLEQEVQEKLRQLNDVTARQSNQFGSPYVPYTTESFEENNSKTR